MENFTEKWGKMFVLKVIDASDVTTPEQYNQKLSAASEHEFETLKAASDFCGCQLHRGRAGYSGYRGDMEYIVYKK